MCVLMGLEYNENKKLLIARCHPQLKGNKTNTVTYSGNEQFLRPTFSPQKQAVIHYICF